LKPNFSGADTVFGQPDFISSVFSCTFNKLAGPYAVSYDSSSGVLLALDLIGNRVVFFDNALNSSNGPDITHVIGQPDPSSCPWFAVGPRLPLSLFVPVGLSYTPGLSLMVADYNVNRVIRFKCPYAITTATPSAAPTNSKTNSITPTPSTTSTITATPSTSSTITATPGLASAFTSQVFGSGLVGGTTGTALSFTIQAFNANGVAIDFGGANFNVNVNGPGNNGAKRYLVRKKTTSSPTNLLTDNGDGTYTDTYTPNKPGRWTVEVTLDGVPLQGSPFRPKIKAK